MAEGCWPETHPPLQPFFQVLSIVLGLPGRTLPVHLELGAGDRGEQGMTLGGSHEDQEGEDGCGYDCGNLSGIQLGPTVRVGF